MSHPHHGGTQDRVRLRLAPPVREGCPRARGSAERIPQNPSGSPEEDGHLRQRTGIRAACHDGNRSVLRPSLPQLGAWNQRELERATSGILPKANGFFYHFPKRRDKSLRKAKLKATQKTRIPYPGRSLPEGVEKLRFSLESKITYQRILIIIQKQISSRWIFCWMMPSFPRILMLKINSYKNMSSSLENKRTNLRSRLCISKMVQKNEYHLLGEIMALLRFQI